MVRHEEEAPDLLAGSSSYSPSSPLSPQPHRSVEAIVGKWLDSSGRLFHSCVVDIGQDEWTVEGLDEEGEAEVERRVKRLDTHLWQLTESRGSLFSVLFASLQDEKLVVENVSGEKWTLERQHGVEDAAREAETSEEAEAAAWQQAMQELRARAASMVKERRETGFVRQTSDPANSDGGLSELESEPSSPASSRGGSKSALLRPFTPGAGSRSLVFSGGLRSTLQASFRNSLISAAGHGSRPSSISASRPGSTHGGILLPGAGGQERRTPATEGNDFTSAMKKILSVKEGENSLTTWFRHFDRNGNSKIDYDEFRAGLESLSYTGDIDRLWKQVDVDESGEVSFDEIDTDSAQVWNMFRRWCGTKFANPKDMIERLQHAYIKSSPGSECVQGMLREHEFSAGVAGLGWDQGFESVFFEILVREHEGQLVARHLRWLNAEVQRYKARVEAKRQASRHLEKQVAQKKAGKFALKAFKEYLKRQYGNLFRAWRKVLDRDESMTVQKHELFKACRQLEYRGDVRSLWKALDYDDSGLTTLDEFDGGTARLMAFFLEWAEGLWGKKPSYHVFKAIDTQRNGKISYDKLARECEARGFANGLELAKLLDVEDKKLLKQADFRWMDVWRPAEWITKQPNREAANKFKKVVLQQYGHMLKAWRKLLDRDGSMTCSWEEFQVAARRIKFSGDVAGAWLFFDKDFSGFITLGELDSDLDASLTSFRRWCHEEFGTVRQALMAMDVQGKGQLNRRQFFVACCRCGYTHDANKLFKALDLEKDSLRPLVSMDEIRFLDDWPLTWGKLDDAPEESISDRFGAPKERKHRETPNGLEFATEAPGPGAYQPKHPCDAIWSASKATTSGESNALTAYPLRKPGCKVPFASTSRRTAFAPCEVPGPDKYNPSLKTQTERKPVAILSSGAGRASGVRSRPHSATPAARIRGRPPSAREVHVEVDVSLVPGPGAYDVKLPEHHARAARFFGRGGMRLHPSRGIAEVIDICSARGPRAGPR